MFGNLFDFDGPVLRALELIANLVILSILTVICMVPVVTFGPAVKALFAVSLKLVRGSDGYIVKEYFKQFKTDFLKNIPFGLVTLVIFIVIIYNTWFTVINRNVLPVFYIIVLALLSFFVLCTVLWAMPLNARFINPVFKTYKLAAILVVTKFGKTLLLLLSWCFIPACVLFVSGNFLPLVFLLETGLSAYLCAKTYDELFREYEERITTAEKQNSDLN